MLDRVGGQLQELLIGLRGAGGVAASWVKHRDELTEAGARAECLAITIDELAARGDQVIGIDRRGWPDAPPGVEVYAVDVRKRAEVTRTGGITSGLLFEGAT